MEVKIEPISRKHAKDTWSFRNNPMLWKYTKCDTPLPATLESEEQCYIFRSQSKTNRMYAIITGDSCVGTVSLKQIGYGTAAIGYYNLRTDLWGKGIVKQAVRKAMQIGFEQMNLDMLYLYVNPNNTASWNLARSLGFYSVGLSLTDKNIHRLEMTKSVWKKIRNE